VSNRPCFFLFPWIVDSYPIAQGPGPPQRPHIPGGGALDFGALSAPTANTLNVRAVCAHPHSGHFTFDASDAFIVRTSCSNDFLQALHVYS